MDDAKKRLRALLNKRTAAQGPDYDEYQISRKVSKTYEPINPSRSKAQVAARKASTALTEENTTPSPVSITVTVKTEE